MSQYFFPAIIYTDIISHITITYRYIMYFFRTFKKSTAPYKVHNMGLRYIKRIQDVHTQLEILQQRLEKPEFVSKQKKEMAKILNSCFRSKHFEFTQEEHCKSGLTQK
jgi:hypothetical protein